MQMSKETQTDEKRSTSFGKIIELMTAKDVAEHEREDEHRDLEQNPDSGGLLLLLLPLRVVNRRRNLRHYEIKKSKGFYQ